MAQTALITGATSGIGRATAELMADAGYNLVLCGRREERLQELQRALSGKVEVRTLAFDVRDQAAVNAALANVGAIDVLVNNAGNAHGLAPIHEGDVEDWEAMLDINVKGVLYVTKAITPGMVARKQGQIINVGSVAGKEVYPNGNVYCASKHALDAINQGLRMELYTHGIQIGRASCRER